MIRAAEALLLPSARLSQEQTDAAIRLEAEAEAAVQARGTQNGANFRTTEKDGSVIAAVDWRLKRVGWLAEWVPETMTSQVTRRPFVSGYVVALRPSDAARAEADRAETAQTEATCVEVACAKADLAKKVSCT